MNVTDSSSILKYNRKVQSKRFKKNYKDIFQRVFCIKRFSLVCKTIIAPQAASFVFRGVYNLLGGGGGGGGRGWGKTYLLPKEVKLSKIFYEG